MSVNQALVHWIRRDYPAVQAVAETQIRHAEAQSAPFWLSMAEILLGAALSAQGQAQGGIPMIRSGMEKLSLTGMKSSAAFWFSLLVESHLHAQDVDAATEVLHALAAYRNPGEEPFFEAEIHRLWGEVKLANPTAHVRAEAEDAFQQALSIARREHAKTLELRAAISLCRLWQQQGKTVEAHALLSHVYRWFTEGFDTGDLTQARRLLQDLEAGLPEHQTTT